MFEKSIDILHKMTYNIDTIEKPLGFCKGGGKTALYFFVRYLSVKTTPTDKRQKNTEKSCAEKSHKQAVFQQDRKQ